MPLLPSLDFVCFINKGQILRQYFN